MITKEYILMCRKAKALQNIFLNEQGLNKDMLPAFVYDDKNSRN